MLLLTDLSIIKIAKFATRVDLLKSDNEANPISR